MTATSWIGACLGYLELLGSRPSARDDFLNRVQSYVTTQAADGGATDMDAIGFVDRQAQLHSAISLSPASQVVITN